MEIRDYNGTGEWSRDQIEQRYRAYCAQYGISARDLAPREHQEGPIRWVYPIMDRVIDGAKEGDLACVQLCLELIQQDQGFPFGMVLKSQAARALRRCVGLLADGQKKLIRQRVITMLSRGYTPREFGEYAKLAKRIGMEENIVELSAIDRSQPYVERFCRYLESEKGLA